MRWMAPRRISVTVHASAWKTSPLRTAREPDALHCSTVWHSNASNLSTSSIKRRACAEHCWTCLSGSRAAVARGPE